MSGNTGQHITVKMVMWLLAFCVCACPGFMTTRAKSALALISTPVLNYRQARKCLSPICSDHFDPALFDPVRNGGLEYGFRPKPADGTGLWASREGDPNGWEAWCRGARFNLDALSHSFRFTMQGAKILLLEDPAQLITLPKLHPWEPKKPLELTEGELPTMEHLKE